MALETNAGIISDIEKKTSFEAMTGRKRGEAAESVIRKGMVGEWLEVFDENEKKKCWDRAGKILELFGYTRDGSITDSNLVL